MKGKDDNHAGREGRYTKKFWLSLIYAGVIMPDGVPEESAKAVDGRMGAMDLYHYQDKHDIKMRIDEALVSAVVDGMAIMGNPEQQTMDS